MELFNHWLGVIVMEPLKSIEDVCVLLAHHSESLAAVQSGRSYMPVAPLLEHPLAVVQSRLPTAWAAAGLPTSDAEPISLRQLILYALAAREVGVYWGTLALSWIESGVLVDEPLAVTLESLARDKRFPQNARHRAFGIAKRWRHSIANVSNHSGTLAP